MKQNVLTSKPRHKNLKSSQEAAADLTHIGVLALGIISIILGAYVGITVISSLLPNFAGAVKNTSANFTTADWGNSTANSLGPIFGLIISLLGMFAIIGLVFVSMRLYSGKKGV